MTETEYERGRRVVAAMRDAIRLQLAAHDNAPEYIPHTAALVHPDERVAAAYAAWWTRASMVDRALRVAR